MDVKEIREALKMSRPQFSEWSGIPVRTLENWESGVRVPPAYVVDLLNVKFREDLKMRNEILRACEAYCDAVRVNLTARIYWNVSTDEVWEKDFVGDSYSVYDDSDIYEIPVGRIWNNLLFARFKDTFGGPGRIAPSVLAEAVEKYIEEEKKSL